MGARLLVISDIHSNIEALDAVLEDAKDHGPYDKRLCAGDIVGYGPNPNEVVELIRSQEFISVAGNHELAISEIKLEGDIQENGFSGIPKYNDAARAALINADALTQENIDYLASLQPNPYVDTDIGIAMVHGSFNGRHQRDYLRKEGKTTDSMKCLYFFLEGKTGPTTQIPIGIVGHTHRPMYATCWVDYSKPEIVTASNFKQHQYEFDLLSPLRIEDLETRTVSINLGDVPPELEGNEYAYPKLLVNPGSVGQPRHGSPASCYAILDIDGDNVTIQFRNVEYDVLRTQDKMWKEGFPYWTRARLERGT